MTAWVYVENNEVQVRLGELPLQANGHVLLGKSNTELKALGWYPLVVHDFVNVDRIRYEIGDPVYTVHTDHAEVEFPLIERSQEDIDAWRAMERAQLHEFISREVRPKILTLTDWTQLPDANPPGGKDAWATYRENIRNLNNDFTPETANQFDFRDPKYTPPSVIPALMEFYNF